MGSSIVVMGYKGADPMKTGGGGRTAGQENVAYWVQVAIDSGNNENKEIKQVIARLESIGVKFPYRPAKKDTTETEE